MKVTVEARVMKGCCHRKVAKTLSSRKLRRCVLRRRQLLATNARIPIWGRHSLGRGPLPLVGYPLFPGLNSPILSPSTFRLLEVCQEIMSGRMSLAETTSSG